MPYRDPSSPASDTQPKTGKRPRGWRFLATLAAASLIISACAGPSVVTEKVPVPDLPESQGNTVGPTDEVAPEGLDDFYNSGIDWHECDKTYECGELEVPMDYANPDEGTFTIALGRRAASGSQERIGSLLINPGGPGGSGLQMLESAGLYFSRAVMERYDIIGFDPRGVGETDPSVRCLTDAERDERRAMTIDVDTEAGLQALFDESKTYAEKCVENTGPALEFIDTVSSASDMDVIRANVGDEKLHYIGFSYGTLLGATYAELFPERVGRLVLDGALDPSLTYEQVSEGQTIGFDRALRAYLEYCLERDSCPLSGDVDAAMQELDDFFDSLDTRPLSAMGDSREVTTDFALSGLIITLYSRDSWTILTMALSSAMTERDGTLLLALADLGADREDDGTYAPGTEAFRAINCLDYDPDPDPEKMRAEAKQLEEISSFFGPALAYGGTTCVGWPYEPKREPHEITAEGAAPILVVGTTRDPATPYEWSEALDEQLADSRLLTYDGDGHTAYSSGSSCIEEHVDAFLLEGVMPDEGLVCT